MTSSWLDLLRPSGPLDVALLVVGSLAASLLTYVAWSYFLHPLAGTPGPLRAQLGIGGWATWRAAKRDFGWQLAALHDKYGSFVRIGRNEVSVVAPAAVSDLYKYGGQVKDKSRFYQFFVRSSFPLAQPEPRNPADIAYSLTRRK